MNLLLENIINLQEFESLHEPSTENLQWITARREKIFVREMETSHIKNCIRCWENKGKLKIPAGYLGGKEKWLKIFNDELINRQ